MLRTRRYNALLTVLLLHTVWITGIAAEENSLTRHSGHGGHDQAKMRWDEWSEWTECSVDCGRGVETRTRDCRSMEDGRVIDQCTGRGREIKLCHFTGCLRVAEDIAECKKLESRVFGGKRYRWEPYKHPRDECELACRPLGGAFYIELGINVTDGTVCGGKRDRICVAGTCKPMGCDNVVESGAVVDNCGVCGGDSTTCTLVSKTFTDSVKFGYQTIGTIPAGATAITISEKAGGRNYLGVRAVDKSFSINTDFRLTRFGDIPGAGTVFKYSRQLGPDCPDECIRADGPTDIAVDIIVLFYSDNTGISYSYNVPAGSVVYSDEDEEGHQSVHIDGGSIPGTFTDEDSRNKDGRTRPLYSSDFKFKKSGRHRKHRLHRKHNRNRENENSKSDNTNIVGETGALNTHKTKTVTNDNNDNNNGIVIESRDKNSYIVRVKDSNKTNDNKLVHDNSINEHELHTSSSTSNKHDTTDSFIEQKGNAAQRANVSDHNGIAEDDFGGKPPNVEDGDNDVDNDDGIDNNVNDDIDEVDDIDNVDDVDDNGQDKPENVEEVDQESSTQSPVHSETDADMYNSDNSERSLYSWLISGYTECSQTCGIGKQSPLLKCIVTDKQARVDDSFCSDQDRPSTAVLECSNGVCPPSWTPRAWSKCSVSCGLGTQSREFVCQGPEGQEVSQSKCDSPKPDRQDQTCDLGSCAVGWYFTEWTQECPARCGYGELTRRVHCSSDSGNINTACNQRDKPVQTKSCRNDDCGGFWVTGPWSKCNATCGMAYQTRPVACAQKHRDRITIVSGDACQDEEQPATYMSCDLDPCGAQWFLTEWGDCAVSCGDGQRSRDVRCLDDKFIASADCDRANKPVDREQCSSNRPCPLSDESRDKPEQPQQPEQTTNSPVKQGGVAIPDDCQDKFSQCTMVLRSKMCQYKYYQRICCRSCQRGKKS